MSGKMFLSFFLIIVLWSASTNAADKLIHCIDIVPFSVEENGKTYYYNSNMVGFKFDPLKVAVLSQPTSDIVDLSIKDTIVTFQAMSFAKKSYFETKIVGLAKKINDPESHLINCYVRAELKNSDETNGLPSKMVKAILDRASGCMNRELCKAIGTVKA